MFKGINEGNYPCPVLYIYGKNDPIITGHNFAICPIGDSTVIMHDKGHVIPKFTGEHMDTFTKFLNRFYEEKNGEPMTFDFVIDEEFKANFRKEHLNSFVTKSAIHKL